MALNWLLSTYNSKPRKVPSKAVVVSWASVTHKVSSINRILRTSESPGGPDDTADSQALHQDSEILCNAHGAQKSAFPTHSPRWGWSTWWGRLPSTRVLLSPVSEQRVSTRGAQRMSWHVSGAFAVSWSMDAVVTFLSLSVLFFSPRLSSWLPDLLGPHYQPSLLWVYDVPAFSEPVPTNPWKASLICVWPARFHLNCWLSALLTFHFGYHWEIFGASVLTWAGPITA